MKHPFPPEETAPTLSFYYDLPPPPAEHVSTLEPHPEGTVSLPLYARLHYQIIHVDDRALTSALPHEDNDAATNLSRLSQLPCGEANTGDSFITTYLLDNRKPTESLTQEDTVLGMEIRAYIEDPTSEGIALFRTHVYLDLARPGFIHVRDILTTEEDSTFTLSLPRYNATGEPKTEIYLPRPLSEDHETDPGDNTTLRVVKCDYAITDSGAQEIVDFLKTAHPSNLEDTDRIEDRFLENCSPAMNELLLRGDISWRAYI